MSRGVHPLAGRAQRIAVVGTGISGLLAARLLHARHSLTVFEADDRIGGHTHTVQVEHEGQRYAVDTGFIVFNDRTYPNFRALLGRLGVASQPSDMSFSVRDERSGLEYCGSSLNSLFTQRRNLLRPSFLRMVRDILRFGREATAVLGPPEDQRTLGELLRDGGYARSFIDHYLVPMGSAIWSAEPERLLAMPARFFVRFFHNHGMLAVRGRPTWHVVQSGSHAYLGPLVAPFRDRIRTGAPVQRILRTPNGVTVQVAGRAPESFDGVVVATHSDQALRLLGDPSGVEREVLGAIPYQENEAVLHTDTRLLPSRRRAWASWNYHLGHGSARATLTYHQNRLQNLQAPVDFCVTLNHSDAIDPSRILRRILYHHPVFTEAGVRAQARRGEVNGVRRTWFCGAWWGYGFHEDGVNSALAVARDFGLGLDDLGVEVAA
ncbi:MAG: FAD-dependent oxidoreductase [Planctomycetes bacterium]|nr:FAD-dependent oxidoreductase [Planctomycetota bacterium]